MSALSAASPPQALYDLLVSLLLQCPQTIEIVPGDGSIWMLSENPLIESDPSFFPFLLVEGNLGLPQRVLYKVYLYAVAVFKSARGCLLAQRTDKAHRDHDLDASSASTLAASSSILILANPSHQTALNTRKHLVRMQRIDPQDDLRFTASLLSSQHCAKHAELWYHRRWLLSAFYDPCFRSTEGVDSNPRLRFQTREAFQRELELISRACELYPRNYFAWTHRLICMRSLLSDYLSGTDAVGFVSTFHQEIAEAKTWIERHISDYTAIHSLLALCQVVLRSGDSSLVEITIEADLLGHATGLLREYPVHESLWTYIQTVLSILDMWQARWTRQLVDDFIQPLAQSQLQSPDVEEHSARASHFARQFLKWRQDKVKCPL